MLLKTIKYLIFGNIIVELFFLELILSGIKLYEIAEITDLHISCLALYSHIYFNLVLMENVI